MCLKAACCFSQYTEYLSLTRASPSAPLQAFARLSAVFGGTYMLGKPDVEVVYDEAGKAGAAH